MRTAALLATLALAACAQADAATRSFALAGFDRVRNAAPVDVRVHVGAAPSARATGPQEVLDRLELRVEGGQLTVGLRRGSWWGGWHGSSGHTLVEVSVPTLSGAAVAGPGDLAVDRARSPRFAGSVSGPGNLSIGMLEAREANLALSGPGDLQIAGRADTAVVTLSGPGTIHARSFSTRGATISLSGPGDIDLAVSDTATVSLSGPGDVRIAGHPRCAVRKSGPGDVTCG